MNLCLWYNKTILWMIFVYFGHLCWPCLCFPNSKLRKLWNSNPPFLMRIWILGMYTRLVQNVMLVWVTHNNHTLPNFFRWISFDRPWVCLKRLLHVINVHYKLDQIMLWLTVSSTGFDYNHSLLLLIALGKMGAKKSGMRWSEFGETSQFSFPFLWNSGNSSEFQIWW